MWYFRIITFMLQFNFAILSNHDIIVVVQIPVDIAFSSSLIDHRHSLYP